jgi:hypothetical protein
MDNHSQPLYIIEKIRQLRCGLIIMRKGYGFGRGRGDGAFGNA